MRTIQHKMWSTMAALESLSLLDQHLWWWCWYSQLFFCSRKSRSCWNKVSSSHCQLLILKTIRLTMITYLQMLNHQTLNLTLTLLHHS